MITDASITPTATEDVIVNGVTFKVRALSPADRHKLLMLAGVGELSSIENALMIAEQHTIAVRHGLVGWSLADPRFDPGNMERNIARLEDAEFLAIARRIVDLSFPSEEQVKNS